RPNALLFKYWMPFFAPSFGTIARRVRRETARQAGEAGRARVVLICDNVVPHEKRPLDEALTRWMLGAADAFVVMSSEVERDLLRFRPGALYAKVPHPLYEQFGEPMPREEARAALDWDRDDRVLLFFGYIRRYKGLDVLLRAMPELRRRLGPRLRLVVLGEFYEDRRPYDRLIEELSLGDLVTMTGDYVPNEQVGPAFSASDLVVLPYRSATQSGIVQVAYQLERPVVCTRVGGLEEMVTDGQTGILVPPDDPAALADAVARYFEEDLEPSLVDGIRAVRANMGWDRLAAAIVQLIEQSRGRVDAGQAGAADPDDEATSRTRTPGGQAVSTRRSASGPTSEGSEP
ncbi:MAG: glycosyltransferase, partial [Candidatus Eisenbacteria bacterium]|nr:glycosyltransferase [Candidatus Eisenbacteria bacterium]